MQLTGDKKNKIAKKREEWGREIRGWERKVRKTGRVKQERGQEVTIKGKGTCTGA